MSYVQSPEQQQQQPQQGDLQQNAPVHHPKRRAYAKQQYDFSAPAAAGPAASGPEAVYGYPAAGAGGAASDVFTPGQPQVPVGVDQASAQFADMNLNRAPSQGFYEPSAAGGLPNAATPAAGYGGAAYGGKPALNQLYNIDVMQDEIPVRELELPPPPLIVPPGTMTTDSPDANSDGSHFRCTLNVVPTNNSLLKKSKLPFALVVRPYAALQYDDEKVPVVDDTIISRCRRCRAYIFPYIEYLGQGDRWKCTMCGLSNQVPSNFDWDPINNKRADRYARKEINHSVVEFRTPTDYVVRAPQPPVFVFVLDVSIQAISSGLLATAARTILESLDRVPNKDNTAKVAFIAVDSSLHFFQLPVSNPDDPSAITEPTMLVVSDLDDPFLPVPTGLLVNLTEARASVDNLLSNLGNMFATNTDTGSALGSAVKAANKLIGSIGGKVVCLTATLPNAGIAKLEPREDRKVLGTPKENQLLQTGNSFYKSFAVECNRSQVTVDMFLFGNHYMDIASLSNLPRFTAGQTYSYPGWTASRPEDATKFAHEFGEYLSAEFVMEAVLRVRASSGIRMQSFYGNFFSRQSDLCSFPTFPRDQSYVIEVALDETISAPWVVFQAAVLHTTCYGERRVRVCNMVIPTSNDIRDLYASADQLAIAAYFTQKAVEKCLRSGLQDARDYLTNRITEIFATYKKELMASNVGGSAPLQLSANLRMLPLLVNALIKHVGLRKSAQVPTDLRSAALCLLTTLPVAHLVKYLYADFYSFHDMPEEAGLPHPETGDIVMPPKLNLSARVLVSHGLFLINDGQTMFLYVGKDAVPQLLLDAFGVQVLTEVKSGKTELPEIDSPLNQRIRAIIAKARESKDSIYWPSLFIVKEDDGSLLKWSRTFFVEDRTEDSASYQQFLSSIRDKINT